MSDTTQAAPADPADYLVEFGRNAHGTITRIGVHRRRAVGHRTLLAEYGPEGVDALLTTARELANADHYCDRLPPSESIIEAALLDAGYTLKDEPAGTGMVAAFDALADASAGELAEAEEEITALRAQRDALLAALRNLYAEVTMTEAGLACTSPLAREHAAAAIAEAEGR